jgi:type IX secretion system protein PorV
MKLIIHVGVALGIVAWAAPCGASGLNRIGTSGAQELRIPIGASSIALGGAAVALGAGLQNLYWNPASLAATETGEAMASYSSYLADSKVNYGAVSTSMGDLGNFAFSTKVLSVGDITVTTEDAPEGTGQILNPTFAVVGLSYARRMTDRVALGVTGSYINESIGDVSAGGLAFDLGVQYDTGWRGLRFGFAMKNFGPNMRFSGGGLEQRLVLPNDDPTAKPRVVTLESSDFELPSYVQLGVAYDVAALGDNRATVFSTFQGNNFSTDEYRLGGAYRIGESLVLRGGYVGQLALNEADRQQDYLSSFTYGAGLNFKLGDRPMTLDWAGASVGDFFSDTQQFTLGIAF